MADQKITTLFVDLGGVLLTNGWDRDARRRAAEKFSIDFADMDERHHLTFHTYEVGKVSLEDYLSRTVFHKERSFTRQSFVMFMYAQSHAHPDMIDLVRRLKQVHGLKIVSVSNEGRELTEYRIKRFELRTFIDCFVSSCFVRARKPDYDIYSMAMDIAQASGDEIVYIEDRDMFVEAAQCVGIQGIVHRDYASTKEALATFGLSLPE
ncbi:MAG TPA: HAD family hydrolase [Syntrophorhabdales bacterium]|nr:HAD family hydrolase [Syntrophorhabdales bacterium]